MLDDDWEGSELEAQNCYKLNKVVKFFEWFIKMWQVVSLDLWSLIKNQKFNEKFIGLIWIFFNISKV